MNLLFSTKDMRDFGCAAFLLGAGIFALFPGGAIDYAMGTGATPEPITQMPVDTVCTRHNKIGGQGVDGIMCYRMLPGGKGTLIQCIGDEGMAAALKIPPCSAFFKK